eukprot:8477076-Alexandrium_andersonii.AAC.1
MFHDQRLKNQGLGPKSSSGRPRAERARSANHSLLPEAPCFAWHLQHQGRNHEGDEFLGLRACEKAI